MTRKHFARLARAVQAMRSSGLSDAEARLVATHLAALCREQNPRFKPTLFYKACGFSA